METKPAEQWTVKEVGDWLSWLELGQYRSRFEQLAIDGSLLFEITEDDLENDFGVRVRLHRFKLLEKIRELRDREPPGAQISAFSEDGSPANQQQVHNINVTDHHSAIVIEEDHCEILILKAVEGQIINNVFIIGAAGASIGRNSASNDIIISESFVSRRHCDIKYNLGTNQFTLADVGSTTGSFIMIREPIQLKLGMMFQMGISEFKVQNVKYNIYGKVVSMDLSVYEGPSRDTMVSVNIEGLTIGRDPANTFSIRDDSQMSSFHSKIYNENGLFWIVDLGSTNRTWLRASGESERSEDIAIYVNDIIKIGSTVFVVQYPELTQFAIAPPNANAAIPHQSMKAQSDETACKICFEYETDAAFTPCGHNMCCHTCALKFTKCPMCRRNIDQIVKLYKPQTPLSKCQLQPLFQF